ncbi:MAG: hypothetical protein JNM39_05245 [Bdellovibrionaceae bacterium]|nr:hypothetical protein [Pseudobdellovibrionaceae bacterium]
MQKQLNPQIFGSSFSPQSSVQNSSQTSSQTYKMDFIQAKMESPHSDNSAQIQSLEEKLERLFRQAQEFQGQISQLAFHSEENLKGVRVKSDRLQQKVLQVEQKQDSLVIETSQKIHFLQQKHIEQKKLEDNVQNLIDRQNNLLKGYEVRMAQMQKILTEKEAQLISTMAALNETKADVQRIKKGYL